MNKRLPISRDSSLSIIFPILFFIILFSLLTFISYLVGLPVYIDFKETVFVENFLYSEEKDGMISQIGWYVIFTSAIFTWRFSRFLTTGKINGALTLSEKTWFKYLFIWQTVCTPINIVVTIYFMKNHINPNFEFILNIIIAITIGYLCYRRIDIILTKDRDENLKS